MNYGTLFGGPVSEDSAALVIRAITLFDQIAGSMMGFYSVKENMKYQWVTLLIALAFMAFLDLKILNSLFQNSFFLIMMPI